MSAIGSDAALVGSIPELYRALLVPLIFEPYAAVLASRVAGIAVISPLVPLGSSSHSRLPEAALVRGTVPE